MTDPQACRCTQTMPTHWHMRPQTRRHDMQTHRQQTHSTPTHGPVHRLTAHRRTTLTLKHTNMQGHILKGRHSSPKRSVALNLVHPRTHVHSQRRHYTAQADTRKPRNTSAWTHKHTGDDTQTQWEHTDTKHTHMNEQLAHQHLHKCRHTDSKYFWHDNRLSGQAWTLAFFLDKRNSNHGGCLANHSILSPNCFVAVLCCCYHWCSFMERPSGFAQVLESLRMVFVSYVVCSILALSGAFFSRWVSIFFG